MEVARNRGLLLGLSAGFGLGLVLYILERFNSRNCKTKLLKDINFLKKAVSELQDELAHIKGGSAIGSNGDARPRVLRRRRRVTNTGSGYDSENTELFTANETEDEEYYDLSSESDEIIRHSVRRLPSQADNTLSLIEKVDALFKGTDTNHREALKLLLASANKSENNINVLWRLAKAYRLLASGSEDKSVQKEYIEEGLKYAKKAVALDENDGDANKWCAVLLGLMSDHVSVKEKIGNGILYHKHIEQALKTKSDDYSLYYMMARFKYEAANITWYERKAAQMLCGKLPEVTIDDAIEDCLKCEELSPEPYADNQYLIAKCLISKGEYSNAVKWLDRADASLTDSPQSKILKKELDKLLVEYSKYRV